MLLTRQKLRQLGMNIDGDCLICNKEEENIGHLCKTCDLTKNNSPILLFTVLNNSNLNIIYSLEHIWININWYNKIFHNPLEKLLLLFGLFGMI